MFHFKQLISWNIKPQGSNLCAQAKFWWTTTTPENTVTQILLAPFRINVCWFWALVRHSYTLSGFLLLIYTWPQRLTPSLASVSTSPSNYKLKIVVYNYLSKTRKQEASGQRGTSWEHLFEHFVNRVGELSWNPGGRRLSPTLLDSPRLSR